MANNTIGTAYIQIEPTTKGISGSIAKVLDPEAEAAGASAGSKLSNALGAAAGVGVAAIAGATAAVGAFGASAVSAGQEFDSSMSQVAATMGYSVQELNTEGSEAQKTFETLRNFAQEMGSSTVFSATESAQALNYMALAGYDANTSMEMLPTVLNLAAAGGIDLASASDMVTDAQTALGLTIDETSTMVDQMAKTASKSNTSVAQLGDAFLTIGANARNLSGGTNELATMLGVLADNGIKGSEAGTHLRNIMLSLNPSTKDAIAAWSDLGISAYDANGNLRPLQDTFYDLNAAMTGMTTEEKTDLLKKMFNKTDLASINALLGTSTERFNELSAAIDDSTSAAEQMAEVQLDNLEGDVTLFKSALEGLQIAISDRLTPTIREFVSLAADGLGEITSALNRGDIEAAFSHLGDYLGTFTVKIAEMAPDVVDAAMSLLEAFASGIGDNLSNITDAAVEIVMQISTSIIDNLPEIIKAGLEVILELANGIAEALPELVPTIIDVVLEITETLIDNVDLLIDGAVALIVGLSEGLIDALPTLIEKAPEIILKLGEALIRNAPKLIEASFELITSLQKGLIDNLPELLEAVPKLIEGLKDEFLESIKPMIEVGSDLVGGIKDGINDAWDDLTGWLSDLCGDLVDKIQDALKIGSPSKVFRDEVGQWIPEGIAVGITANADSVEEAMNDVTSDALMNSNRMVSNLTTNRSFAATNTADSTDSKINMIVEMMQTYLPNMATNDKLNNLNFNVNNREFARLVNEVQ